MAILSAILSSSSWVKSQKLNKDDTFKIGVETPVGYPPEAASQLQKEASRLARELARRMGHRIPKRLRTYKLVTMSEVLEVEKGPLPRGKLYDIVDKIHPFESHSCPKSGRIFQLVSRLASGYQIETGIDRLPVPINLITHAYDNLPIEVRRVPLKAYHGAVWRLNDCWLVHLNYNDTPARQRFTIYHEIFHILAHCKATPVFKKTSCSHKGTFNELLADHFAAVILLPEKLIKEKWLEVKDVSQMAALFDVPKPVMYLGLKAMRLI